MATYNPMIRLHNSKEILQTYNEYLNDLKENDEGDQVANGIYRSDLRKLTDRYIKKLVFPTLPKRFDEVSQAPYSAVLYYTIHELKYDMDDIEDIIDYTERNDFWSRKCFKPESMLLASLNDTQLRVDTLYQYSESEDTEDWYD